MAQLSADQYLPRPCLSRERLVPSRPKSRATDQGWYHSLTGICSLRTRHIVYPNRPHLVLQDHTALSMRVQNPMVLSKILRSRRKD